MPFETDQQTLSDLSLSGGNGQASISQIFKPVTLGGLNLLKSIFDNPLNDISQINTRLSTIRYLNKQTIKLTFDKEDADFIEYYLRQSDRLNTTSRLRTLTKHLTNWLKPGSEQYIIKRGVQLCTQLLVDLNTAFIACNTLPTSLQVYKQHISALYYYLPVAIIGKARAGKTLSAFEQEELDYIFRYTRRQQLRTILDGYYQLDVFTSAAKTVSESHFSYPEFKQADHPKLTLTGFFHPFVAAPVSNDIEFLAGKNVFFITGANMAGKSTLLKSIGICIYLAHLGLPVPAAAMQTIIFNGLFTTINLADNVVLGHSHFYREVLRIKEIAVKVGTTKNILVIFDELFRGTNVKDAYDASLAIIKAFTGIHSSVFIISTHIVEVADELKNVPNLFFNCLTTTIVSDKPVYTYRLQPGISNERLGMQIINDEGLIAIINQQAAARG